MKNYIFLPLITLTFSHSCTPETTEIVELPPSIIYADDNSTILSYYSNVGEKGPNLAPYFCASLEDDLEEIFNQKNAQGEFKLHKKDGSQYDIYSDQLKIYTSINPTMQKYAEDAIRTHLTEDLQPAFSENNSTVKRFPFSNTYNGKKVSDETIENILNRARSNSKRYKSLSEKGLSEKEVIASFDEPTQMKLFSWKGGIDTILSPNDSILYSKNMIRSSLLSIEPSTGFVKAWVGGIDFEHFPFDGVKTGKRQMGSTMKPFLYSTAMSMGVIKPCTVLNEESYCVDPCDPSGKRWCPSGTYRGTVRRNFISQKGLGNVAIASKMGACSGPQTLAKILGRMNINIPENQIVPSMCLGTPDVSLFNLVAANAMFVNGGVHIAPQTVLRIEDNEGNVIYSAEEVSREVMNSSIAFEMLQMMKGVAESGTSTSLKWHKKWGGIEHPTAATTGTTQGNSDGWFIGLTPDLVTGVWGGGEDKQVRFRSMLWGQGARMCLPIYGYFMQKVYADDSLKISTADFESPKSYDPKLFECSEDEKLKSDEGKNAFGIEN